ncbi:MAG: zf-HC2 domain-containing protein [Acidobacteriota bacterium]|nr:zf-HC2 domain-containing protein [Acidobacteriota bacterium]
MNTFGGCDRKRISGFLGNTLNLDDKLEFLLHLDTCSSCWNQIYAATKARYQQDTNVVQPKLKHQAPIRARAVRRKRRAKRAV